MAEAEIRKASKNEEGWGRGHCKEKVFQTKCNSGARQSSRAPVGLRFQSRVSLPPALSPALYRHLHMMSLSLSRLGDEKYQ